VSQKKGAKVPKPAWYKNTYFWIAGILLIIGFIGLIMGQEAIRDPGQRREGGLAWLYFAGALIMLVNGYLSHRQTVLHYEEAVEGVD
jgi:nucleoside-specific outer membrane channel protein Tsx